MSEWLDKVEQDLKHASENGDRTAQIRLFVHHIPQMINKLRALEPIEVEVKVEEAEEDEGITVDPAVEFDLPDDEKGLESMVEAGEIGITDTVEE